MVNLKDFNFFIALDASVTADADAVLDETYFILNKPGQDMVFELKYPEKSDFVSEEQFVSFFSQLKLYVKNGFYFSSTLSGKHHRTRDCSCTFACFNEKSFL